MSRVDKNNSGVIDYTGNNDFFFFRKQQKTKTILFNFYTSVFKEFVMATINRKKVLSKQRLEKAFKMFDKVNF